MTQPSKRGRSRIVPPKYVVYIENPDTGQWFDCGERFDSIGQAELYAVMLDRPTRIGRRNER